jgi:hypothetical protein
MRVADLMPGNIVSIEGIGSATFVAHTEHPLWPHLRLVIWKLDDGTWSHDALDARQEVGTVNPWDEPTERIDNLRRALLGRA